METPVRRFEATLLAPVAGQDVAAPIDPAHSSQKLQARRPDCLQSQSRETTLKSPSAFHLLPLGVGQPTSRTTGNISKGRRGPWQAAFQMIRRELAVASFSARAFWGTLAAPAAVSARRPMQVPFSTRPGNS